MDEDLFDYAKAKFNNDGNNIIKLLANEQTNACKDINDFLTKANDILPKKLFKNMLSAHIATFLLVFTDNFDEAYNLISDVKERIIKLEKRSNAFQQSGLK